MYFPYFRGKQFELVAVRESANLLSKSGFVPIIEPVREGLSGLQRALDAVSKASGKAVLIVNPSYGDHAEGAAGIDNMFAEQLSDQPNIATGIILRYDTTVPDALRIYEQYSGRPVALVHAGFTEGAALAEAMGEDTVKPRHIFHEQHGRRYRQHFKRATKILLRDGFERRKNREHPRLEFFSDLHATYEDEGVEGFGDFLIVGDDYTEGGGPAYAVAIHLTFIDRTRDDDMYMFHFKSKRQDTPTDPAGKFAEALDELVEEVNRAGTHILRTDAVNEFLDLHRRGHFPGLGYVKKLSMKHHIETLANYFAAKPR